MHLIFPSCFSVDYYQVTFFSHLYENRDRNESNVLAVLEKKILSQLYSCKIYKK